MLGRVKRWLLAMLARKGGLRVAPVPPRKNAALLTRPALRGVLNLSGRRASRQSSTPLRGVEQRALSESLVFHHSIILYKYPIIIDDRIL
jgi:hypothetical protein